MIMHTYTNVPTKYQLSILYGFNIPFNSLGHLGSGC